MSDASNVLKMIKDNEVQYVDLRFTDPRGKMQHLTLDTDLIDEDFFSEGTMFDGSSIAGWKAPSCRTIQARNMKPVIWATARAPKAATSRSIRSIAAMTCVRKCFQ